MRRVWLGHTVQAVIPGGNTCVPELDAARLRERPLREGMIVLFFTDPVANNRIDHMMTRHACGAALRAPLLATIRGKSGGCCKDDERVLKASRHMSELVEVKAKAITITCTIWVIQYSLKSTA